MKEGKTTSSFPLRLSPALYKQIQQMSLDEKRSMNNQIVFILETAVGFQPDEIIDNADKKSYVYLLQYSDTSPIKIGYSQNPEARAAQMTASMKKKVYLVDKFPAGKPIEQLLHERFADFRLYGEWFEYSPNIIQCLQELRQQSNQNDLNKN